MQTTWMCSLQGCSSLHANPTKQCLHLCVSGSGLLVTRLTLLCFLSTPSGQTTACVGYQLYFSQQQALLEQQQLAMSMQVGLPPISTPTLTSPISANQDPTSSTTESSTHTHTSTPTQHQHQRSDTAHSTQVSEVQQSHIDSATAHSASSQDAVGASAPHLAAAQTAAAAAGSHGDTVLAGTSVAAAAVAAATAAGQHAAVAMPHIDAVAAAGPHVASAVVQVLAAAVVAVAGQHIDVATAIDAVAVATAAGAVANAAGAADGRKAVRWTEQQLRQVGISADTGVSGLAAVVLPRCCAAAGL